MPYQQVRDRRIADAWADQPLDAISATDVEAMQHQMAATARSRRNSGHGRHAGEHVVAAARALFNRATADSLLDTGASTAHKVAKPAGCPTPAAPSHPTSLRDQLGGADERQRGLARLAAVRLHTETACCRGRRPRPAAG